MTGVRRGGDGKSKASYDLYARISTNEEGFTWFYTSEGGNGNDENPLFLRLILFSTRGGGCHRLVALLLPPR